MKLEVGKKYKTKAGLKAFVFSMRGRDQEAIGYIELPNNDGDVTAEWFSDGTYYMDKREAGNDIVAEWSDTPEPGEGWRLISPGERLEVGDQWWCNGEEAWIDTLQHGQLQAGDYVYRRRIAPKCVPYTWEDREELRGKWYRKKGDNSEFMVNYIIRHNESEICIGPWRACEFLGGCEWLDGTPCGKVVN
jgi:hypothetical protein